MKLVPRHYDYVLGPPNTSAPGPNQTALLSSIAPGQIITGIPLTLDSDAPFLLRGRALRVPYPVSMSCTKSQPINNVLMRYTGPNNNYLARGFVRQSLEMSFGGQFAQWRPVSPQVLYPASGTILVDIQNDSSSVTITNLTLYFRGVKLYPEGSRPAYTYPPKYSSLPFVYPVAPVTPSNPAGLIQSLGVTETRLNQIFTVQDDADFVLRSLQLGGNTLTVPVPPDAAYFEVFVRLRDPDNLAYSNDYVHVDVLGGYGDADVGYGIGSSGDTITPSAAGPANPGWLYPEIYLPRNAILKYDIQRTDSAYGGCADTLDFPIALSGSKIFYR